MTWRSVFKSTAARSTSCACCGKPALFMAGNRGFCRDHKSVAEKVQETKNAAFCAKREANRDAFDWEAGADRKMRRAVTKKEWK